MAVVTRVVLHGVPEADFLLEPFRQFLGAHMEGLVRFPAPPTRGCVQLIHVEAPSREVFDQRVTQSKRLAKPPRFLWQESLGIPQRDAHRYFDGYRNVLGMAHLGLIAV